MQLFLLCDNLRFTNVKMIQIFLNIGQLVEIFYYLLIVSGLSFLNCIIALWRNESNFTYKVPEYFN